MQIYVSGLIEIATSTLVGGTWVLDRDKVMVDLGITDQAFNDLQQQIEGMLPGRWDRASAIDCKIYRYLRVAE